MEAGWLLTEQNGSNDVGCLPELGGHEDGGGETDREFTLDNLFWALEEGEILEMCNAVGDGGGGEGSSELKEDPEPPGAMEIEAVNGCHDDGGGDGGSGVSKKGEAMKECYGDGDGGSKKELVMKRGSWTAAEDALLIKAVQKFGLSDWVTIEKYSGLARTSKSCRLRWINHLRPNLKKGAFSFEEVRRVVRLHYKYGNKWSRFAKKLPGRTDNEIKNFWHSLVKKCKKQGLPLYPDWCREEKQTSTDDDSGHYNVDDQQNLISIPMDDSSASSLFARISSPEFLFVSPPPHSSHAQKTLPICSDQNLVSSSSLLPQNHPYFAHEPSPLFQTAQVPILEFPSPQAHISFSCQQPLISPHDISHHQTNSTFQLPETQLCTLQEQDLSGPHYLPSSHEPGLMDHSTEAPLVSIHPPSQSCFPSFQNFLSPRPKHAYSSISPSQSSSSALPQLFSPQQHCSSSAQQPSSICYANTSVSNSSFSSFQPLRAPPILSSPSSQFTRFHRATCELPTPRNVTDFLFPEQAESVSAPAASVSPFDVNASSTLPYTSAELNSSTMESPISPLKLNLSTKVPTLPSTQSNTSFIAPVSCPEITSSNTNTSCSGIHLNSLTISSPHSSPRLKLSTPTIPDSNDQTNPSITAARGSSPKRNSTLELPVSSLQLNSSTSPKSSFVVKSEPPSIQFYRTDFKSIPDMRQNLEKAKSKMYSEVLDALLQETQAEASLFDLQLIKGFLLSKRLKTKHLYGNILRTKMKQNITSHRGVLLRGSPGFSSGSLRKVDLLGQSQTREVTTRNRLDTQYLPGNYLCTRFGSNNNSRTGVLLEENTRKALLRKLLKKEGPFDLSSQKEVSLSEGSIPEDSMLIESLDRENSLNESLLRESSKRKGPMTERFLRESSKRRGPVSESLEKMCSMSTSSKRDQNSRRVLSGKNLWSEDFLTSQEQTSVPGKLDHLNFMASDVSGGNLHSAQFSSFDFLDSMHESSKRICFRDENLIGELFGESSGREGSLATNGQEYISDALGPLFCQSTAITPLRFGDFSGESSTSAQSYNGGCLAESFCAECTEDQTLMDHLLAEMVREEGSLESKDQLYGICESSLFRCKYASPSLIRSIHPGAELSSPRASTSEQLDKCAKTEDSSRKSLEKSNFCEPVLASIEQKQSENGMVAVISQSTAAYLLKSRGQNGESGLGGCGLGDSEEVMRELSHEGTELASLQEKPLQNQAHFSAGDS